MSDEEQPYLPLPAGAEVEHLASDLVLLSFPMPKPLFPPELTGAEREVTRLVYYGASNVEIARARRVSPKTIANQLDSIYRKIGVTSRCELISRLIARRAERAATE